MNVNPDEAARGLLDRYRAEAAPAGGGALPIKWDLDELRAELARYLAAAGGGEVEAPPGFRADARGNLISERNVSAAALLEDQTVWTIMAFGFRIANEIARFRERLFGDAATFLAILDEHYGAKRRGGRRGNITLRSFCGRLEVSIRVQDRIVFGPELQVAKSLIDELAEEWTEGAQEEVRVLIRTAFDTDREGDVSISAVLRLRKVEIADPRWAQAMEAIGDAIRVVGSKSYANLYCRPDPQGPRFALPINIASDWTDPAWDAPRDPVALRARYAAGGRADAAA